MRFVHQQCGRLSGESRKKSLWVWCFRLYHSGSDGGNPLLSNTVPCLCLRLPNAASDWCGLTTDLTICSHPVFGGLCNHGLLASHPSPLLTVASRMALSCAQSHTEYELRTGVVIFPCLLSSIHVQVCLFWSHSVSAPSLLLRRSCSACILTLSDA